MRDNIPDIIADNGGVAHVRRIDGDREFIAELSKKLIEEAHEAAESLSLEELADVREVFDALAKVLGYSDQDIKSAMVQKAAKNGAFNNRIYLINTEN